MSSPTLAPNGRNEVSRTLAYEVAHAPAAVKRAAQALAWQGSEFLVGIADVESLVATLATVGDLDGVVRIGSVRQPRIELLRALYSSDARVLVERVALLPTPWAWRHVGDGAVTGIAIRSRAYWDIHEFVARRGLACRLLPDAATSAELLTAGLEVGSVVADVDEAIEGDSLVDPAELSAVVCCGLLKREIHPESDYFWLALTAQRERPGVLSVALSALAEIGVNLDFLHSDDLGDQRHAFYLGFSGGIDDLRHIVAALTDLGFDSRVLAGFVEPG